MKDKLCIIISTRYCSLPTELLESSSSSPAATPTLFATLEEPTGPVAFSPVTISSTAQSPPFAMYECVLPDCLQYEKEIIDDINTVRSELTDYEYFEIDIPVSANQQHAQRIVKNALSRIHSNEYTQCHIVLNSHGVSGKKDINDEVVKSVIKGLSSRNIIITQFSALICNAMRPLSAQEACQRPSMRRPRSCSIWDRHESTMQILQQRLNALETEIPQHFSICGSSAAYDPSEDSELVRRILRGDEGIEFLAVTTQAVTRLNSQQIFDSIAIITTNEDLNSNAYQQAADLLGKVLNFMADQAQEVLKEGSTTPSSVDAILLNVLSEYCVTHRHCQLNAVNFKGVYEHWKKEYKARSPERKQLLEEYATYLNSLPQETSKTIGLR